MTVEAGKLLTGFFFIIVSVVAIITYISITTQISSSRCKEKLSGSKFSIINNLVDCVKSCWNKHNFGKDPYSDDCYIISVFPNSELDRTTLENYLSQEFPVKVRFDSLQPKQSHRIKIRYNASGKEIDLILWE